MKSVFGLTDAWAAKLAQTALSHVTREYPNKLDHILTAPADVQGPRALHPVFFGSFDWHSCVHGYWLLARLRRSCPALPQRGEIALLFDSQLTPANLAQELAYFERPASAGFERPYGWAWLLMLAAELLDGGSATHAWHAAVADFARAVAARLRAYLPSIIYPIRTGTHLNSAFALVLALKYAHVHGDRELAGIIHACVRKWFERDAACQAWEPSGDDFLSPALIEAECVRRVLGREEFTHWFTGFLPNAAAGEPAALFTPATVHDRSDGKTAHLDGLNLSRAWCWRSIAASLAEESPVRARALAAAETHLAASLPYIAVDYAGTHWLSSFALLALDIGAAA